MIRYYRKSIKKLVKFLCKHRWFLTAAVLGTFLTEPWQTIKASLMWPTSWKKHFNFYNLNPKTLTKDQLKHRPILLLHGSHHNQSAWLSLAKKLKKSNLGPVYTINLTGNDSDYDLINLKILQILSIYRHYNIKDIKIDLVGHSRGGFFAHQMAWFTLSADGQACSKNIGKVIKIGDVLEQEHINQIVRQDPNFRQRIYEIIGTHDILVTDPSLLPSNQQKQIQIGHLGLLYSSKTHQSVIDWLKNPLK